MEKSWLNEDKREGQKDKGVDGILETIDYLSTYNNKFMPYMRDDEVIKPCIVYLVWRLQAADRDVIAVFDTREAAEAYVDWIAFADAESSYNYWVEEKEVQRKKNESNR